MTTPFDKFNNNSTTGSSNSFSKLYESYRQTYSNIDAQYGALANTSIYTYGNRTGYGSTGESTASKVMKWTGFGVNLLGGLASAGAGIASAVMMGKAMKSAAQGTRAAAGTTGTQQTTDFTAMTDNDLAMKKAELTDKIYLLGNEAESAAHAKTEANGKKNEAKEKADAADKAYGDAKTAKAAADENVKTYTNDLSTANNDKTAAQQHDTTAQQSLKTAQAMPDQVQQGTDPETGAPIMVQNTAKQEAIAAANREIQAAAEELKKAEADIKEADKNLKAAQKESEDQKKIMDEQDKIRKEQTAEFDKQSKEAIAKQKEETTKKNAKEAAERELQALEAEENRRLAQPASTTSTKGKKKKK